MCVRVCCFFVGLSQLKRRMVVETLPQERKKEEKKVLHETTPTTPSCFWEASFCSFTVFLSPFLLLFRLLLNPFFFSPVLSQHFYRYSNHFIIVFCLLFCRCRCHRHARGTTFCLHVCSLCQRQAHTHYCYSLLLLGLLSLSLSPP